LSTLPEEIDKLTRLTKIDVSSNMLVKIPDRFVLTSLDTLKLGKNKLKHLPKNFSQCVALKFLELQHNSLESLPSKFTFTELEKALLYNNKLVSVPSTLFSATALLHLDLSCNYLTSLPPQISNLTQLHFFNLASNNLTELPDTWSSMTELNEVFLNNNQLTTLPPSFGALFQLRKLALQNNKLRTLPEEFGALRGLEELNLSSNLLKTLPDTFSALSSLGHLIMDNNRLTKLPVLSRLKRLFVLSANLNEFSDSEDFFERAVGPCTLLDELRIAGNKFTSLSESVTKLRRLRKLFLGYNRLTSLPKGFEAMKNMITLHLGGNKFEQIPTSLFELDSLDALWLNCNAITQIPSGITALTALCCLDLSVNAITELPTFIGQLSELEELVLSHNQIPAIPTEIIELKSLRCFDIAENPRLTTVPKEIFLLPKLQHLKLFFCGIQQIPFWELDSNWRSDLRWMSVVGNPLGIPLTAHFRMIADIQTVADEGIFSGKSINYSNTTDSSQQPTFYSPPYSKKGVVSSTKAMRLSEEPKKQSGSNRSSSGPTALTPMIHKKNVSSDVAKSSRFKLYINSKIDRIWEFSVAEMKGIRPTMEDTISIAQSATFRIPVVYRKSSLKDDGALSDESKGKVAMEQNNKGDTPSDTFDDVMFTLFCVFDGHSDSKVAEFCASNFHKILFHKFRLAFTFNPNDPKLKIKEIVLPPKPKLDPIVIPKTITTTVTTTTVTTIIIKTKDGKTQTQHVETVVEKTTTTAEANSSGQQATTTAGSQPSPPPPLPETKKPPLSLSLPTQCTTKQSTTPSASISTSTQERQKSTENPLLDKKDVAELSRNILSQSTVLPLHSVGKVAANASVDQEAVLLASNSVVSSSSTRRLERAHSVDEVNIASIDKTKTPPETTKPQPQNDQKMESEKSTETDLSKDTEIEEGASSPPSTPKRQTHKGRQKSNASSASSSHSHKTKNSKNGKKETHKIKPEDKYDFHETSEEEKIPKKHSEFDLKIKKAIEDTFQLVSDTVAEKLNYKSGCTAVIALFQERVINRPATPKDDELIDKENVRDERQTVIEQIWFANCGDARAVSCRKGHAIRQSKDHKPLMKSERLRVQSLGGLVSDQGRIQGSGANIAVARAIGDKPYHPFVSNRPYINCYPVTEDDEFVILACDGVWDVLSDEEAVNLVRKFQSHLNPPKPSTHNTTICGTAPLVRDIAYQLASGDNISVIVVSLKNKISHIPSRGVGIG
jgi:Leucine-rich repeat (LRR) protein/serine/threonine protein phosphatase PrpC